MEWKKLLMKKDYYLENILKGSYSDRKIAATSILAGLGVVVLIIYLAQNL